MNTNRPGFRRFPTLLSPGSLDESSLSIARFRSLPLAVGLSCVGAEIEAATPLSRVGVDAETLALLPPAVITVTLKAKANNLSAY